MNCLWSINSLYVEKDEQGYVVRPCCVYDDNLAIEKPHVDTPDELLDNPAINHIRKGFRKWKRNPGCINCVNKEKLGLKSKRQSSLLRGGDEVTHWDLRPGNVCNLKCAMCSLKQSSKWIEDVDILTKFAGGHWSPSSERSDLDWDWLYSKMVNKATFVYVAGGEPFYMKEVQEFFDKLSKNPWNAENTTLQIQTNGVSNTPKFINILKKFKKIEFSISLDGWGEVNELVRFPTDHNVLIKNANELFSLDPQYIYFNITTQAMNLPNIDKTISEIENRWNAKYDLHKVTWPEYLQINALKPHVVKKVLKTTKNRQIQQFCRGYRYNDKLNKKMQTYLLELDTKRGTNSKEIIPWCFE